MGGGGGGKAISSSGAESSSRSSLKHRRVFSVAESKQAPLPIEVSPLRGDKAEGRSGRLVQQAIADRNARGKSAYPLKGAWDERLWQRKAIDRKSAVT